MSVWPKTLQKLGPILGGFLSVTYLGASIYHFGQVVEIRQKTNKGDASELDSGTQVQKKFHEEEVLKNALVGLTLASISIPAHRQPTSPAFLNLFRLTKLGLCGASLYVLTPLILEGYGLTSKKEENKQPNVPKASEL